MEAVAAFFTCVKSKDWTIYAAAFISRSLFADVKIRKFREWKIRNKMVKIHKSIIDISAYFGIQ